MKKTIRNGWVIQTPDPQHAEPLEALQRRVFPTLSEEEILTASHYRRHLEIFPEGQFVVLDGEKVIGMSTTMRSRFSDAPHTFLEISGNLWLTTHQPEGEWLYGLDLGVDPAYRQQGIAREIYRARQETARQLGLKGQLTVGMLNGYAAHRNYMTVEEYFEKLQQGQISDPTVSVQQRLGFRVLKLMKNYLDDPACGNAGVLMTLDASMEI